MAEWNINTVPREEWIDEFLNLTKQIPKYANELDKLLEIARAQAEMLGELEALRTIFKK